MAIFTIPPDFGTAGKYMPRVLKSQFGDGYSQRVGDGINTTPREWPLVFSGRTTTEKDAILAFLEARNGIESFDWTPPYGPAGKFLCSDWTVQATNVTAWTINATFKECFL